MSELAHRDHAGDALAEFIPDRQRAMVALGFNPANPHTHAALLLANTYGLDPVLGHLKLIPGKGGQPPTIWVTRDGYLFKAKQHPEWDGLDLVEEDDGGGPPDGVYFCRVVCRRKGQPDAEGRAWYRWKQAKSGGGFYIDEHADEMCLQRAERRALRRQFPLSIFELAGPSDGGETVAPATVVEIARAVDQGSGAVEQPGMAGGGDLPAAPAPADPAGEEVSSPASSPATDASAAGERDTGVATGRPSAVEAQTEGAAVPGGVSAGAVDAASGRGEAPAAASTDLSGVGPVTAWCLERDLSPGTVRLFLARQHPAEFGRQGRWPVGNVSELDALRDEAADRALDLAAKQFPKAGEPKGWEGGG